MSSVSTTLHRTQIVVSADSDDDEGPDKSFNNGQPSSPLSYRAPARASTLPIVLDGGSANPLSHKYPHTRTCLVGIIRDHHIDVDNEGDEADGLLHSVVSLLKDENEEELKELLKSSLLLSNDTTEQVILDLMHSHRDDLTQAPLTVLQSAKRPISRPSSRASSHSFRLNRPESPLANYGTGSAPSSPKPIQLSFRRPHTPVTSPLVSTLHANASSYMTIPTSSVSPTSSPPLPHAAVLNLAAGSPSSSPLSSPRFLNAKEFKPKRPLSIGSNPGTATPDVWSPGAAASSLTRTSSNLAIAQPVVLTSRSATPVNGNPNGGSVSRPGSSLGPSRPPFEDEDDDEFSPFSKTKPILYRSTATTASAHIPGGPPSSEGTGETSEHSASSPSNSYDPPMSGEDDSYPPNSYSEYQQSLLRRGFEEGAHGDEGYTEFYPGAEYHRSSRGERFHERGGDREQHDPNVPEGMTPLDVLVSVFGATMSPYELEDLLAQHAWNFDDTMQFLIERGPGNTGTGPPSAGPYASNSRSNTEDRNATFVGRQASGRGPLPFGAGQQQNRQMNRPGRVCRYFLAGECLRSDCRFSHDLDRALCRFWLRGVCAKGDNCEFMHRLPPNMEGHGPPPLPPPPFVVNPNINGGAKAPRFDIRDDRSPSRFEDTSDEYRNRHSSQEDEFPALGSMPDDRDRGRFGDRQPMSRQGSQNIDPSRSRFASAVKKAHPAQNNGGPAPIMVSGAKFVVSPTQGEDVVLSSSPSSASLFVPKPSPRIKLRPPTLLPTIPTGDALNKMYMTYRERPLQLQAARNACLARAADAWRRNDGASAKRFSRDANELNAKMGAEAREAAGRLVAERTHILMGEIRTGSRGGGAGRAVGGGLGVVLGVAGLDAGGSKSDNEEMRTEVAIDLHGLHASEGVEYLDEFMLALEKERFLGLTYVIVGEEKHTGTQDPARGASRLRLAAAIKESLYQSGYAWNEWKGIICIDVMTHY
ncbi:hypothetical protein M408DRAFT_333613 [Serendipita vermifera MAFF 305830]|uniref:C3H1-type domain-containing protein n=1 Tax=Serendipita vermifera MAFF 305830 TaxID=933852 RepID=A0A0C2W404_SERVB|nr:hypothetical protein M408DRAFT_333613 [Serendipita vermifera MAFF 305830]